jgi:hypothetical protein
MDMNKIKDTTCQSEVVHQLFANVALIDRFFVCVIRAVVLFPFTVNSEDMGKKNFSLCLQYCDIRHINGTQVNSTCT